MASQMVSSQMSCQVIVLLTFQVFCHRIVAARLMYRSVNPVIKEFHCHWFLVDLRIPLKVEH